MEDLNPQPLKQPYRKPNLAHYGDINTLTTNAGSTGRQDGQGTGKTKTG
jgi:hypothetical protein